MKTKAEILLAKLKELDVKCRIQFVCDLERVLEQYIVCGQPSSCSYNSYDKLLKNKDNALKVVIGSEQYIQESLEKMLFYENIEDSEKRLTKRDLFICIRRECYLLEYIYSGVPDIKPIQYEKIDELLAIVGNALKVKNIEDMEGLKTKVNLASDIVKNIGDMCEIPQESMKQLNKAKQNILNHRTNEIHKNWWHLLILFIPEIIRFVGLVVRGKHPEFWARKTVGESLKEGKYSNDMPEKNLDQHNEAVAKLQKIKSISSINGCNASETNAKVSEASDSESITTAILNEHNKPIEQGM